MLGVLTARRMHREEALKRMGVLDRSALNFFAGDIKVPSSRAMALPLRLQPLSAAGAAVLQCSSLPLCASSTQQLPNPFSARPRAPLKLLLL